MAFGETDEAADVKGVVIISLPPPDNPSLGKTITAFSVTDDEGFSIPSQPWRNYPLPPASLSSATNSLLDVRFFLLHPKKLIGFLGISLFAFLIFTSFISNAYPSFNKSEDDGGRRKESDSFVFPVYRIRGNDGIARRDVDHVLRKHVLKEKSLTSSTENADSFLSENHESGKLSFPAVSDGGGSSVIPVRGNVYPDGLYYTYVLVGDPPRPYYLDIDTGSDLTWVQCDAPCSSCAKGANALYKPRRSNIVPYRDSLCGEVQRRKSSDFCETCQQCDYEVEYADSSSSFGVLAKDVLHLMASNGSFVKSNFIFGCGYDQQGLLLSTLANTDGIIGLSGSKASLPAQLARRGIIKNVVGHCFTKEDDDGGYMFFGDDFIPHWGMVWVPMITSVSQEFYQARLGLLKYGNTQLRSPGDGRNGRIMFDSGSSYTYFTKEAYADLIASLEELAKTDLKLEKSDPDLPVCWRATSPIRSVDEVKQFFKAITFQFEGKWRIMAAKFRIPPEGFLIISKKGNVCLGILDGSKVLDGSAFVIGDVSLHGMMMVYDNENKKIGWMPSGCSMPNALQGVPFFDG